MLIKSLVPPSNHSENKQRIIHAFRRELSTTCSFRFEVLAVSRFKNKSKSSNLCDKYEQKRFSVS